MFKLISLALAKPILRTIIGLLAVISIAPKSEATISTSQPISLQQPAGDLIATVGDRGSSRNGSKYRKYDRNDRYDNKNRYDSKDRYDRKDDRYSRDGQNSSDRNRKRDSQNRRNR